MANYIRSFSMLWDKIPEKNQYPFSLPVVRNLESLAFETPVTFFVGDNGTGKSTLIEAIAIAYGFNPEGGSKNFTFSTSESHSELYRYLRIAKDVRRPRDGYFLRAESFYNLATEIDNIDPYLADAYGGRSLHAQSHGESFLALMQNRFYGNGLYIFDEPEAALSPVGQMSMLKIMHRLATSNSQLIIATHSPILMAYPGAVIYEIGERGIQKTSYRQTDHYMITKYFLNNTEKVLEDLLQEEDS